MVVVDGGGAEETCSENMREMPSRANNLLHFVTLCVGVCVCVCMCERVPGVNRRWIFALFILALPAAGVREYFCVGTTSPLSRVALLCTALCMFRRARDVFWNMRKDCPGSTWTYI